MVCEKLFIRSEKDNIIKTRIIHVLNVVNYLVA